MNARLLAKFVSIRNSDRGATAVEYGLMVALIAIVIIVAVEALGLSLDGIFNQAVDATTLP